MLLLSQASSRHGSLPRPLGRAERPGSAASAEAPIAPLGRAEWSGFASSVGMSVFLAAGQSLSIPLLIPVSSWQAFLCRSCL